MSPLKLPTAVPNEENSTWFNEIGLQTANISMLKAVVKHPCCYFSYVSIALPHPNPSLSNSNLIQFTKDLRPSLQSLATFKLIKKYGHVASIIMKFSIISFYNHRFKNNLWEKFIIFLEMSLGIKQHNAKHQHNWPNHSSEDNCFVEITK